MKQPHLLRYSVLQMIETLHDYFFMSHATGLTHVFQSEEGDSNGDIEIDLSDLDAGTLYRLQVINIRG